MLYLVNRSQTADERRDKYMLLKDLGFSVSHCKRMRDWRWSKIRIAVVDERKCGVCAGSKKKYLEMKTKEEEPCSQ